MADSYQLQYDEQGRPYYQLPGQRRNYVSPVAMGGQAPKDETSILRSRPQWNNKQGKWETPIDWGNILNIGVGAGLGVGGLHALGTFGAGAGAAGAGAEAMPAVGIAPELGGFGLTPAMIAENAAAGAAGTAGAAGAGGWAKNLLGNLTSMKGIGALASLIPALMSGRNSGGGSGGGGISDEFVQQAYADAKRQNEMQQARYRRVDPLHEAVTQLAHSRLPTNVQRGELPRVPLPE